MQERPDMDDLPHTEWKCEECGSINSMLDGECQYCDGSADLDVCTCDEGGSAGCPIHDPAVKG